MWVDKCDKLVSAIITWTPTTGTCTVADVGIIDNIFEIRLNHAVTAVVAQI